MSEQRAEGDVTEVDPTTSVIRHLFDGELPHRSSGLWVDREGWPDAVSNGVPVTPDEQAVITAALPKRSLLDPPKWTPEMRRFVERVRNDPSAGIRFRKRPAGFEDKIIQPSFRNIVHSRWLRVRWERDPIIGGFFRLRLTIGKFEIVLDPISKASWRCVGSGARAKPTKRDIGPEQ